MTGGVLLPRGAVQEPKQETEMTGGVLLPRGAVQELKQETEIKGCVVIPKGAVCYCQWCHVFFRSWMKLKSHLMQEHRGKRYRRAFKCGHCWAGFKQMKSLQRHVSTGNHSFPYRVGQITIPTEEGNELFQVLQVPDFQVTVSLRDGVLAD